jgi:hypothetical protein
MRETEDNHMLPLCKQIIDLIKINPFFNEKIENIKYGESQFVSYMHYYLHVKITNSISIRFEINESPNSDQIFDITIKIYARQTAVIEDPYLLPEDNPRSQKIAQSKSIHLEVDDNEQPATDLINRAISMLIDSNESNQE